jgi:hypothetical protein
LFAFIVGESNVIRILVFVPFFLLFPEHSRLNIGIFELVLLVYVTVALKQFFNQNIALTAIKSIFVILFMIIFYWILTILASLAAQAILH